MLSGRAAPWVAFASGALAVGGFAPAGLWPVFLASLALLFALWTTCESPRRAAWLGWWWGLGFFGVGVSWVWVSLHVFGGMPSAVAALATAAFCAYLALFPALAGSLSSRFGGDAATRLMLLCPGAWVLGEWLRGWLLTGFPWLAAGYSQTDTPLAGFAPLAGIHGTSLATALVAGALAAGLSAGRRRQRVVALFVVLALTTAGVLLRQVEWTGPAGGPIPVALVQGNVPQSLKFEPQRYAETLATYRRLVESSDARLIVLPETAIPRFIDAVDPAYLDALAAHARGRDGDLLLGAPFRDASGRYYNGIVSLGSSPTQFYAKRHLVPFGEFVPPEFAWLVAMMRIPLSDFSPGGPQAPMWAAGTRIGLSVCYEDVFGEESIEQLPAAALLVNVSNVAWFGDSLAPEQHLQIARLRALESGRWMLRATNTGATAIIDERGTVVARLPAFVEGVLTGTAQPRIGATPYVRAGNAPALLAALLISLAAIVLAARGRRRQSG